MIFAGRGSAAVGTVHVVAFGSFASARSQSPEYHFHEIAG